MTQTPASMDSAVSHGGKKLPLSVIVPTFNRPAAVTTTIDHLLSQSFTDFELWVIDQSDPEPATAITDYIATKNDSRVKYLYLTRKGLPNARNEGLSRAAGEIIVFVDDDVLLLTPDFLSAHLAAYRDPKVGGVTGRHVERLLKMNAKHTACHVSWSGRTIFNLFGHERQPVKSCKGSNMSYRAAVVDRIQGFDRKTNFLEDTDFSVRVAKAGWTIMFEPEAELVHLSTKAGGVREKSGIETEYARFRGTAYFILKHRGVAGAIPFVATFSLIALIRALRFRSLKVLPGSVRAICEGFALTRGGPDEAMPPRQDAN